MIKAHTNTAEAAIYALRYIINAGINWEQLLAAMERMRGNNYDRYILQGAQAASMTSFDLNTALAELARCVWFDRANNPAGAGNLIESVARVLSQDLTRNRLSGDSIRRLREVLLLPDEIAAAETLQTTALSCGSCHVAFADGDVLTKGGDAFFCSRCKPTYMVLCSHKGCEERITISNWEKVLSNKRCQAHKDKREEAQQVPPIVFNEVEVAEVPGWAEMPPAMPANAMPANQGAQARRDDGRIFWDQVIAAQVPPRRR